MAEGNQADWQLLCAAVATEPDSKKVADLVDQIIRALDKRKDGSASYKHFDE
jgi:hypothetical protein